MQTTTDNASNFVKSFTQFHVAIPGVEAAFPVVQYGEPGSKEQEESDKEAGPSDSGEQQEGDDDIRLNIDVEEPVEDLTVEDVDQILGKCLFKNIGVGLG